MTQIFDQSNHASATRLLTILGTLLIIVSSSTLVLGMKTGELSQKVINPLKNEAGSLFDSYMKFQNAVSNSSDNGAFPGSQSSSTVNVDVNTTNSGGNNQPQQQYTPPAFTFPVYNTPTPNPTIIEWERQFNIKQQQMNQQYEDSKQKVCAAVPDAPGCQ